jgi:hypothetical protein
VRRILAIYDQIIDSPSTPVDMAKAVLKARKEFEESKGSGTPTWKIYASYNNELPSYHQSTIVNAAYDLEKVNADAVAALAPRIVSREPELRRQRRFDESLAEQRRIDSFKFGRRPPLKTLLKAGRVWRGEGTMTVETKTQMLGQAPTVKKSDRKATVKCTVVDANESPSGIAASWTLRVDLVVEGSPLESITVRCASAPIGSPYGSPIFNAEDFKTDESGFKVSNLRSGFGLPDSLNIGVSRDFRNAFNRALGYGSYGTATIALYPSIQ